LEEGATVTFIARYRKEATGSLDEPLIAAVRDRLALLEVLDKRKAFRIWRTLFRKTGREGKQSHWKSEPLPFWQ
jgi:transcriptional accessory protein Tex/SPT6